MTVQPILEPLDRPVSVTIAADDSAHEPPTRTTTRLGDAVNEASRSAHLRTQFLRRVAHDIASPTGVTMTVLEELANESSRPELVAMARRGLRRLLRLSEQLALAGDLEAGTFAPDATLEDMRNLVKDALTQAVAIDGRRDVVTSCEVPDAKLAADVDRRVLGSVLRELIGNALRLASSRVAVDVQRADGKVTIRIQDDGPGFPAEALATLGQRFTAGSTTRGLGLSISMAKEVLAAHGGTLDVEASGLPPGRRGARGAAVLVTLPLM
ncbi:MAG: HAMP domain-containing histidine kinase [Labilithrix sp.]|nr:HAMP domain-containing histidine kinase [Labilithrix sp.]MBX3221135.1 HAMP domain-containing histidine kinase [Labilithrix sp.]